MTWTRSHGKISEILWNCCGMRDAEKEQTVQVVAFGPYKLDLGSGRLWRGAHIVKLTPKAFAALRHFVARPGQLVTKDDLFAVVWPRTVVSESTLASCIQALRRALRDKATAPRYLETVHRRGYRFLPAVTTPPPVVSNQLSVGSQNTERRGRTELRTDHWQLTTKLVGRDDALAYLHERLEKALSGERQLIFVTGEPGIGKTALLQGLESRVQSLGSENQNPAFSGGQTLDARRQTLGAGVWLGWGQCIEHYGAGEAYLPLLSALGQLSREPGCERLVAVLQQHAPTWLVQLPALMDSSAYETLQRKTHGATRERMLREMAEALEVLTTEQPLVVVLEDLHWSDPSTLELLAFIARRRQLARLLILATYRPVEMLAEGHPLQGVTHELFAHDLSKELALSRLSEVDVAAYLTLRFPESVLPTRLGQVLYHRTGGTPLFLVSIVQDLISREMLHQGEDGLWMLQGNMAELETWTPESVRHVLARQRECLTPEEQQVLQAASLAGLEFSAAAVAAALETKIIQVEEHCGRLAERQQFLRPAGISAWPDGTRAARYGFLHALYQEFWHERVSVGKQQQWHLRMGEWKEAVYGARAQEIAAELALHFEQGRDYRRAVQYLQGAGRNAMQRNAAQEASSHFTKGLELLRALPSSSEHARQELALQIGLGSALSVAKGLGAQQFSV